jgi:apolipoprotein D and lipocalin family protein
MMFGCTSTPKGVTPVASFNLERYLGTWYEIARLDHRFERGLSQVSAIYSQRADGGIDVRNSGYSSKTGEWKDVSGRAYRVGDKQLASLKVTFFWPFYAGYHVIMLDQQGYSYALVCGPDRDYLWILARTRTLDKSIVLKLVNKAEGLGFDTNGLVFVDQDKAF